MKKIISALVALSMLGSAVAATAQTADQGRSRSVVAGPNVKHDDRFLGLSLFLLLFIGAAAVTIVTVVIVDNNSQST